MVCGGERLSPDVKRVEQGPSERRLVGIRLKRLQGLRMATYSKLLVSRSICWCRWIVYFPRTGGVDAGGVDAGGLGVGGG